MIEIENRIREMIFAALSSPTPHGVIKCEASDETTGMTGRYLISSESGETADFLAILPQERNNPDNHFTSQIKRLYQASRDDQQSYPWYRCNIEVEGERCTFRYWREDPNITDLSTLEPDLNGHIPRFPFRHRLPLALLRQLAPKDYGVALFEFATRAITERRQVPEIMFGYFAIGDWLADTNNGSFNQYFSRRCDYSWAEIPRTELYPRVRNTLELLGLSEATRLFEEGIAIHSHFHQRVDQSRREMGIAAIPKQTESDIMGRFFDMQDKIESRMWAYFGEHLTEFAVE